ncbi:MAG TPA: Ig-like domain-containing protein [Gemmatimonadaceae bacterium]|nr:Ig-like domain-containing protein [Gemmatimonadaceae bacterium]
MKIRSTLTLAVLSLAALLSACDEEEVTGPGFICDVTNPVQDIFLVSGATSVMVHSPAQEGDTIQIVAVATNRFGTARTDVPIKFTSSDVTVATVDSLGVVHAVAPGTATIKAAACGESKSVAVTVVATVASVTVTPQQDTVIAGDTATFIAHAQGQNGEPIANVEFTFSTSGPSATVIQVNDSTARIATSANGAVGVTARGEGATGTATLLVLPRIFLAGSASANTIDVGDGMACGIITLGQGFCWGVNNHSQLAAQTDSVCFPSADVGIVVGDSTISTSLPCSLIPKRISQTLAFASISAGDSTGCAITTVGRGYCWGLGAHGETGTGSIGDRSTPTLISGSLTFTSISVGGNHACGIADGGIGYCWGDDAFGQLGDARTVNSTTPIPVSGGGAPAVFSMISAGFQHTCALTSDGTAFCWGRGNFGQLGNGGVGSSDTPVAVATGSKFTWISAGGDHTCGITTTGAALCWGSDLDGQLGDGALGTTSLVPVAVAGGLTFTRISASTGTRTNASGGPWKPFGHGHTCALTAAGSVFCWGDDTDLQLGRGPYTGGGSLSATPVQVGQGERPAGVTFTSVSTGSRNSCGVGSDGNAYCWGSNIFGALGNTLQAAFRGFPQKVATPR